MRLRARAAGSKQRCKVEVPASCTVADLKQHICQQLGAADPAKCAVSLNEKTPLSGEDALLTTLGVCSGDLIWVRLEGQHNPDSSSASAPENLLEAATAGSNSYDSQQLALSDSGAPQAQVSGSPQSVPDAEAQPAQSATQLTDEGSTFWHMVEALHTVLLEVGLQPGVGQTHQGIPVMSQISTSTVRLAYRLHSSSAIVQCSSFAGCFMAAGTTATACHSASLTSTTTEQRFAIVIKDMLALPLLADMCTAAGLVPPADLLSLPSELKLRCLSYLKAEDLARAACTCSELRVLASSDELWQPLYEIEFGTAEHGAICWMALYAANHRRRAEWDRLRLQHRHPRHAASIPWMTGGISPFMPAGPRPLIIGGDMDRLPLPFSRGSSMTSGSQLGGFGRLHGR